MIASQRRRRVELERNPDLGAIARRKLRLAEIRSQHSDDRVRAVIQLQPLPNHVGVAAKAAAPEIVADDDWLRGAWPFFFWAKRTPELRRHAERRKEVRR